jgi:hypothetical protein
MRGHLLRRPERDYGVDVTMFHFDGSGEIENGEVRFQLKATDKIHIPATNKLTVRSIDTFRRMSLQTIKQIRQQGGFPDARRYPK